MHNTLGTLVGVVVALAIAPVEGGQLRTDFTKSLVPVEDIIPGGPPPDGIPALDRPVFTTPGSADAWLRPAEAVLALQVNGDARAYPLRILIWHEIVNDTVGGKAVAVTYCPLCNSGLVFDRRVNERTLDFGTSGMLYKSDLVMYDRQTHSLWAQMEGRAIVGELTGTRLTAIPANTIAYADFKAVYPAGKILSQETGYQRRYGLNPYGYYDQPTLDPFLLRGAPDRRRPPKERVVGVLVSGVPRAYPWRALVKQRVVHDTVGGEQLVIFYQPGVLSALDEPRLEQSRPIGATAVFSPTLGGRSLRFEAAGDGFRDRETGSVWNLLGHAVKGPLADKRLRAIPHVDAFWFAWAAFHPSTSIYAGP